MVEAAISFWGEKDPGESQLACFLTKERALAVLRCPEDELTIYLDDFGVTALFRGIMDIKSADRVVQNAFIPSLHALASERIQKGIRNAYEREDLYLYLEEEITSEFALAIASKMNLRKVSFDGRTDISSELGVNLTGIHCWQQVYETVVRRAVRGPEAYLTEGWPPYLVTSGSQAGKSAFVEVHRLFWKRFLKWSDLQYQKVGFVTALDVGYINQLCADISLCGFILACADDDPA
jgi:hypothetical protein